MADTHFDPNGPGIDNGRYFGLPFTAEESRLVLLPVGWDVTTSYREGTAKGPEAIQKASLQVDLYDPHHPQGWRQGIGTLSTDESIRTDSKQLRKIAQRVIEHWENGGSPDGNLLQADLARINQGSETLNRIVYETSRRWIEAGKKVGIVGGDHSSPLGAIRAAAEHNPGMGILHIDAHADLREAYEGFTYSHASIMYNVLHELPDVSKIVQVGIRDYCDDELALATTSPRVVQFTDYDLSAGKFERASWQSLCQRIVSALPEKVYISFDIDGLCPDLCPHTGTPVPGGLTYQEAVYLLVMLTQSGREIVGFDLCEVAPDPDGTDEWDANVGARMLYKLCNLTLL